MTTKHFRHFAYYDSVWTCLHYRILYCVKVPTTKVFLLSQLNLRIFQRGFSKKNAICLKVDFKMKLENVLEKFEFENRFLAETLGRRSIIIRPFFIFFFFFFF